jgi:Tol biopolymer transport system component
MSLVYRRSPGVGGSPATLLIGAAIASAAILLALTAATANAAFPGRPGPIAYPLERTTPSSATSVLYTQDPRTGAGRSWLRFSSERLLNPSFSRSGEWIAYEEGHDFPDHLARIWRISSSNRSVRIPVTDGAHIDSNPSYFPGGGRIVFDRYVFDPYTGDGFFHIFAISVDTGVVEQLTFGSHNDTDPVVNPRRGRIAFVSDKDRDSARDHSDIWVMRTQPPYRPRVLIDGRRSTERAPDYAPNGRWIAFDSSRGRGRSNVFVAKASGRRVRRVTHSRYDCFRGPCYSHPAFSPNGRKLAVLGETRYSTEVAIVRRNGRRLHTFLSAGTEAEGYGTTLGAPGWGREPR